MLVKCTSETDEITFFSVEVKCSHCLALKSAVLGYAATTMIKGICS